jgi:hypothetical protein
MPRYPRHYAQWLAFFFLSIIFFSAGSLVQEAFISPVDGMKSEVVKATPTLVTYTVRGNRIKACASSDGERFILSRKVNPTVLAYRDRVPIFTFRIGSYFYQDSIVVAPPLESGAYDLEIRVVSFCGAIVRSDAYPTVSFTIP